MELVDGQTLQCELGSEDHSRQMEVFRKAQSSFNRYRNPLVLSETTDFIHEPAAVNYRPTPLLSYR